MGYRYILLANRKHRLIAYPWDTGIYSLRTGNTLRQADSLPMGYRYILLADRKHTTPG